MALIKCKMCGGDLVLQTGSAIAECEYCGTVQTVPAADNEKKLTLFNRANRLRYGCEFDKAAGVYEAIVADFPEEPEAYWGLVLCKYGIEYVDDPATGKKIPTCHRSSFESVMENDNFQQVLENSDVTARKLYREEAKQIEELRKGIIEVSAKEEPYDIFICYKETAEDGQRTLDSVLAQDVYGALTEKGYRVFFSRITLEDKLGQEYEPYIFAALNSARVMLVFGTDYEYFNAVWVRNEWSRFLELIAKGEKKTLIPCYKDIDAYDLPKEFSKLQAQDMGKVGAVQDLLRGIDKLIEPAAVTVTKDNGVDVAGLLARGDEALQLKEWEMASSRFDLALMADPNSADAYVGKLMAERRLNERKELGKGTKSLQKSLNYREAIRCADDAMKQELEQYEQNIRRTKRKRRETAIKAACATFATAVVVFLAGWAVVNWMYEDAVADYRSGASSPQEAYERFEKFSWYKEDEGLMWLAAAGMGAPEKAEGLWPKELRLTDATIDHFFNRPATLDESQIERIEFEGTIETNTPANFAGCSALKELDLPEGVRSIGTSAFSGCESLRRVTIPGIVDTIGASAFKGCSSLTEIVIPEGVTTIEASAFEGCGALKEVVIPEGVKTIGAYAFQNCGALKMISLPQGLERIEGFAFAGSGLESVMIPERVTAIGDRVFFMCASLQRVGVSKGVIEIGPFAFALCSRLEEIDLPETLERIGSSAFNGCGSLEKVVIPESVTEIDWYAFEKCDQLKEVYCAAEKRPSGWASNWIPSQVKVVWGAET